MLAWTGIILMTLLAASVPVAVIVPSTVVWPGAMTVTVGNCELGSDGGALSAPKLRQAKKPAMATATMRRTMIRRRRLLRLSAVSSTSIASASPAWAVAYGRLSEPLTVVS